MANTEHKHKKPEKQGLIDPFYKKYVSSVIKTVTSEEYYKYFMKCVQTGRNMYQFTNRQVEKEIDETWVNAVEAVIKPMTEIINNPRNFIIREEIIVNVALSKKAEAESIKYLCSHGDMIDEVNGDSVRPNRMLQVTKEDSINTYENRFVYTLLELAWEFVDSRYEAIFAAMGDEYGAHLILDSESYSYLEKVVGHIDLKIQQNEDQIAADEKSENIFARISRIHRNLGSLRSTGFARQMSKYGKVKAPIVKTNAIKKNPNFKACHKLWDFITTYEGLGYHISVREQSQEMNDDFLKDIYNSLLYNYLILKHHLDSEKDRLVDYSKPIRKKEIDPKFINKIIEEEVKDPNVVHDCVKRVLVENVTKADLLQLEAEERKRLVEEKEKEMREIARAEEKKRQEEEKARKAEEERLEKERQKEAERIALQERAEREAAERKAYKDAEEKKAFTDTLTTVLKVLDKNRSTYVAKREEERKQAALKAAKEEKERIAAEKREAARLAEIEKAEKARIAAEKKAEADRKAAELALIQKQADEARIIAEQAEAERKIAENREAIEKLELERNAVAEKAEAERIEAEKRAAALEEERLAAKAEADKKAAELEEKRLANKAESDKLAKELEAQRQAADNELAEAKALADKEIAAAKAAADERIAVAEAAKADAKRIEDEATKAFNDADKARKAAEKKLAKLETEKANAEAALEEAERKAEDAKKARENAELAATEASKQSEAEHKEAERIRKELDAELSAAKDKLEKARLEAEVIRQETRLAEQKREAALKVAAETAAAGRVKKPEEITEKLTKKQKKAAQLKEKRERKRAFEQEQREKGAQKSAEAKEARMREQEALMAAAIEASKKKK